MEPAPRLPRVDVICEGDAPARAEAQGRALRDRVAHALHSLPQFEAVQAARPWWLTTRGYLRAAERRVARRWPARLRADYPQVEERIEALAGGADLPPRSVLLLNAMESLLSSVRGRVVVAPLAACSAVGVRRSRSASGEPVIARNFDYLPITQPTYAIRDVRPENGLRSLQFTLAPLVGTVDGINEAGLTVTYNYGYCVDDHSWSGTISMVLDEILARCRTVDEAVDHLLARPRWGGGLVLVADAAGELASVELSSTRAAVRVPDGDLLYHTNCFHEPETRAVEVPRDAIFRRNAPRSLVGRRVLASAETRLQAFESRFREVGAVNAAGLTAILGDHDGDAVGSNETLCVHGSYWFTTATMQYYPASRRMRVSYSTACQADYVELALD